MRHLPPIAVVFLLAGCSGCLQTYPKDQNGGCPPVDQVPCPQ